MDPFEQLNCPTVREHVQGTTPAVLPVLMALPFDQTMQRVRIRIMHDEPQRPELPLQAPGVRQGSSDDVASGGPTLLGIDFETAVGQVDSWRLEDLAVKRDEGALVGPHIGEVVDCEAGCAGEGARVAVPLGRCDDRLAIGKPPADRPAYAPTPLESKKPAHLVILLYDCRDHIPPYGCNQLRELRPQKGTRKRGIAALKPPSRRKLVIIQVLRTQNAHPHATAPDQELRSMDA